MCCRVDVIVSHLLVPWGNFPLWEERWTVSSVVGVSLFVHFPSLFPGHSLLLVIRSLPHPLPPNLSYQSDCQASPIQFLTMPSFIFKAATLLSLLQCVPSSCLTSRADALVGVTQAQAQQQFGLVLSKNASIYFPNSPQFTSLVSLVLGSPCRTEGH